MALTPHRAAVLACAVTALLVPLRSRAQSDPRPVVYNDLSGDGGVDLDRQIKDAYGKRYTIRDTRPSDGYVEPSPTAGVLPREARDPTGQQIVGYVLAVYIVSEQGLVQDPVVVRSSDARLAKAAMDAMAGWRFKPGAVNGTPVATTAAQEFNFGPVGVSGGFLMTRLVVYQDNQVLLRRLPPKVDADVYLDRILEVAHNFFVGDAMPETLHIVMVVKPGRQARIWFVSSARPPGAPDLEPLRKLLAAVTPLEVKEGPVILTISGAIMGGDGTDLPEDRLPIPAAWKALEAGLKDPLPVGSDAFLALVWPDSA